jgi:hypothetical protein
VLCAEVASEWKANSRITLDDNLLIRGRALRYAIEPEMMDLGAYGIAWFRVMEGDKLLVRVNATLVKAVIYAEA